MTSSHDTLVYKILSAADWQTARALGHTRTALDEGDGYVHLSTRQQVEDTLRLHYAGQERVWLLEYDLVALPAGVRWEESRSGQLFPHLYGRLDLAKAKRRWMLAAGAAGVPALPGDIDT